MYSTRHTEILMPGNASCYSAKSAPIRCYWWLSPDTITSQYLDVAGILGPAKVFEPEIICAISFWAGNLSLVITLHDEISHAPFWKPVFGRDKRIWIAAPTSRITFIAGGIAKSCLRKWISLQSRVAYESNKNELAMYQRYLQIAIYFGVYRKN